MNAYGRMKVNKLDRDSNGRIKVELLAFVGHDSLVDTIKNEGGNYIESLKTGGGNVVTAYIPEDKILKIKGFWMENCLL
jgi:hypothetical protein